MGEGGGFNDLAKVFRGSERAARPAWQRDDTSPLTHKSLTMLSPKLKVIGHSLFVKHDEHANPFDEDGRCWPCY